MNTVLRKSDGAMVVRWIPGFPKGKGILDAVNSGKGEASDLKEIQTTDQEYMDNWYQREPREAVEREAKISAEVDRLLQEQVRPQAIENLITAGKLPANYEDKEAG